ncbi:MAG: M42 family metallopeptidase [Dehalococcoidia bacterium]|nr:M42 family metallopeptidase [Dehalococcoidia bacterium]
MTNDAPSVKEAKQVPDTISPETHARQRQLLEELSNAFGPTGHEGPVRAIVRRELTPLVDDVETDGIGSVIARIGDETEGVPRIMIAGHMDEVGLMVRQITAEGYLTIQTLGGWLDQSLINQRWVVMTRNGPIPGLTGIKTVHVMQPDARTQVFKKENMFIDVGAKNKEDAEQRLGIRPGDPVAPDSRFQEMAGGELYLGKAWDDRAGVAGLIEIARAIRESADPLPATVYLVATVQEEVGLRGAHTSSFHVMPDIGLNLESGVAGDYPGITKDEAQEELGKGPTVFLHDSSMIPNLRLRDFIVDTAADLEMPLQFNVLSGYGEDGAEMQKAGSGAPSINIAIPTRYLHSHNGIIHRDDFANAVRLVTAVLHRLTPDAVTNLTTFD